MLVRPLRCGVPLSRSEEELGAALLVAGVVPNPLLGVGFVLATPAPVGRADEPRESPGLDRPPTLAR